MRSHASHLPAEPLPIARGFRAAEVAPSRLREFLARASQPGVISFALGLPAEELFPVGELARAQARLLPQRPEVLQYAAPNRVLKSQIVDLMAARGVTCGVEQVFLTSGAQQGMDLLTRLFVDPGSDVLLEETVYDGFRLAVGLHAARMHTVPADLETGLDVRFIEELLASGVRPRVCYTIPSGHNPLGVSLSPAKRQRLVALAREFSFPILEDDAYGFLHYEGEPPLPLRALEERWVLYLGSFSKILTPSLRAGWLVVPEELIPRLSTLRHAADVDTLSLSHHIVSEFLASGALADHLTRLRTEYRRRRDTMLECLSEHLPASVRWTRPASGMFIWIELPPGVDAASLLEVAIEHEGVAFCPGEAFAVSGGHYAARCLRLSFTSHPPERIAEGIRRLARAIARAVDL